MPNTQVTPVPLTPEQQTMVLTYTNLVRLHARRFFLHHPCSSLTLDDLLQEGFVALCRAVPRYDATCGPALPFFHACVARGLTRAWQNQDALIRLPEAVHMRYTEQVHAARGTEQELFVPTAPPEQVPVVSGEQPLAALDTSDDLDVTLFDNVASPDDTAFQALAHLEPSATPSLWAYCLAHLRSPAQQRLAILLYQEAWPPHQLAVACHIEPQTLALHCSRLRQQMQTLAIAYLHTQEEAR